jgi:hypothetical protein
MAKLKGTALADEPNRFVNLGSFEMADNPRGTPSSYPIHNLHQRRPDLRACRVVLCGRVGSQLFEVKVRGLEARFFGDADYYLNDADNATGDSAGSGSSSHGRDLSCGAPLASPRGDMGEGMAFKEDNFLTSANLCRWIIDFNEISMGKQVHACVVSCRVESCGVS